MKVSTLLALMIVAMLFAILGILSIYKPNIIGAEFYWAKWKCFYVPKYIKPTNKYYLNYIKIIGLGFIFSAVVLLIVSVVYAFYPPILSIFQILLLLKLT
ncbi:hypothetical protein [Desulfitobacterium metallireducens]|uniref:Uncharacterized protein n=1 Tax=Desulfitobacterium metallireducens DSM 15288 TaxID=871968 RepID=W0EA60_9FIRM|nr:hypothetical protein [Desulfitobacterium metallireducens]AHF06114.1 hypothetical protein DESME_02845 [Desulfitobacterium metallireducens DSM 15288]